MSLTARSRISDREKAGLRGPVRTVSQGATKTEYDRDGRLINNRWLSNPNSESVEAWTYDSSGRLLSDTVRDASGTLTEKTYFYGNEGKLARIVHGGGDHTSFQYDEEGRKTEVREIAHASDVRQGAIATSIDVMFANVEGDPEFGFDVTRNAGRIKTIYDEHEQPTETQAFDAEGNLLGRIVRTYDEIHRITSVRMITDDLSSLFSAKQKTEMAAQANLPLDEIKAHFKKAFGAKISESAISHTYDSQGRRTKTVLHHGFLGEVTRTYSYNDYGDVIEERTTFPGSLRMPEGVPFHVAETGEPVFEKPPSEWPPRPALPEPSAVHYDYQYDSHGNWTEQTTTGLAASKYTRRRELTYY